MYVAYVISLLTLLPNIFLYLVVTFFDFSQKQLKGEKVSQATERESLAEMVTGEPLKFLPSNMVGLS